MKKSILGLEGVVILNREQQKIIHGGGIPKSLVKVVVMNSCVSSSTCSQGCEIIDDEGCSECSGCCIA